MSHEYLSVFVSLTISLIFIIGVIIYRYIFPRKTIPLFTLMLLISTLPLFSIFRYGTYESGDFNIHVYRTISFVEAIKDGQILPSWPKDLNATYGYPLFFWMNSLPYYLISLFHLLGFSFIMSAKLFLFFAYIFSGISFWLFAKKNIKNTVAVFVGTIFYLFAPYHFVDLHFRAAIGETLSFVILPLFMLSIQYLYEKRNIFSLVLLGLCWGVFVMTHHAISVFSLGIGTCYFIFLLMRSYNRSFKLILYYLLSIMMGFLLSLYVWLPHVVMAKYTYGIKLSSPMVSFPTIADLLFSPYRYGLLFQGPQGELSFTIGYVHLLFVVLGLIILIRQKVSKSEKPSLIFYLLMFGTLVFMMNPLSSFIWDAIPLIKSAQFSTRLLVIMTLVTSMIAVIVVQEIKFKKSILFVFVTLTIGITILNWGHRRVIPEITDDTLKTHLWLSTARGEGFYGLGQPKWLKINEWFEKKPVAHIEIIKGDGNTTLIQRTSDEHIYKIVARTPLELRENTLYFPGWEVLVNEKPSSINPNHTSLPGVMTFKVPRGEHTVRLTYADIPTLRNAKIVSVSTLALILVYFGFIIFRKIRLFERPHK